MISRCLLFLFSWSSMILSDFQFPGISHDFGLGSIHNLSCKNIQIGAMSGTFDSSQWSFITTEMSNIECYIGIEMGILRSSIISNVNLNPSHISIKKSPDNQCFTKSVSKNICKVNLKVKSMRLDPPNFLLQFFLGLFKSFIEAEIQNLVCDIALPQIELELQNHTINPPQATPSPINGATPLYDFHLLRGGVNVVNNIPEIFNMHLNASIRSETTTQLGINIMRGFNISLGESIQSDSLSNIILENTKFLDQIKNLIKRLSVDIYLQDIFKLIPTFTNGGAELRVPGPFNITTDISLNDLKCDENGNSCTIPCTNSINLQNIRVEKLGEWDRLIVNYLGPLVSNFANMFINSTTSSLCSTLNSSRLEIPMKNVVEVAMMPSTALWVSGLLVALAILVGVIILSIIRHRRSPITLYDGSEVSLKRILVEDITLTILGLLSAYGFLWSNSTSAATLILGNEVELLSFSLMETTKSLYNAGLKPFAILVFIFSGVYPYLKLLCILICTLFLQKPELVILKVVDYIGKFSFLDSYAMVIMASGLQMKGIAEVRILPGFYIFLTATILSILTGNFATGLWRRNTSIRTQKCEKTPNNSRLEELPLEQDQNESNSESSENSSKYSWKSKKYVITRILSGLFTAACILPAWIIPCIRYRITGVASVLEPDGRPMNLYELASTSTMLLITCIFTIGIAPFLYALLYPRFSFLASWSAADALLLSCIAGLLQLGQFVEFIIGKDMHALYSAEAQLLWPLIFLLISSVWQWILVSEHLFGLSKSIKGYWKSRQISNS